MFADLPLHIQGIKGVEDSLSMYMSTEQLQGENQYFCGVCKKKVNAKRCVKMRQFPPILTLGLNRFEMNYKTSERKKV